MKTLLILRHAKSSWDDETLDDFERPLNERGQYDAPRIGRLLRTRDLLPEKIFCSTALRARSTLELVCEAADYHGPLELRDDLYLAPASTYINLLKDVAEPLSRVLVIGHNPGLESLVTELTGAMEHMPTGGLAVVELPIDQWHQLRPRIAGRLLNLFRPKTLDD